MIVREERQQEKPGPSHRRTERRTCPCCKEALALLDGALPQGQAGGCTACSLGRLPSGRDAGLSALHIPAHRSEVTGTPATSQCPE